MDQPGQVCFNLCHYQLLNFWFLLLEWDLVSLKSYLTLDHQAMAACGVTVETGSLWSWFDTALKGETV